MSGDLATTILAIFLIFCRIGCCLMILPGLSSGHIGQRARLLIAIAVSVTLAPMLLGAAVATVKGASPVELGRLIVSECLVGLMIGFMGRLFFLALDYMLAAIASFIGFGGFPGTPVEQDMSNSPVTSLVGAVATLMVFLLDLHHEAIGAIVASYDVLTVGKELDESGALANVVDMAAKTFLLSLSIGAPLLVYSVVANVVFGIANKQLPQVPIFFISVPFILAGGIVMLALVMPDAMRVFMAAYSGWLREGGL